MNYGRVLGRWYGLCRKFLGLCLKGAWSLIGGKLDGAWNILGLLFEGAWLVLGGCF